MRTGMGQYPGNAEAFINKTSFNVGDTMTVNISNATPGAQIFYSGTVNGNGYPATVLGNADASGNYVFSYPVTAALTGQVTQQWYVDGVQVASFFLTVGGPAATSPATQPLATPTAAVTQVSTPVINQPLETTPAQVQAAAVTGNATSCGDWFTDPACEIVSGFPNWELLAAGVIGLVVMMSMNKGKH